MQDIIILTTVGYNVVAVDELHLFLASLFPLICAPPRKKNSWTISETELVIKLKHRGSLVNQGRHIDALHNTN